MDDEVLACVLERLPAGALAVTRIKLNYHNSETVSLARYPYASNLNFVPEQQPRILREFASKGRSYRRCYKAPWLMSVGSVLWASI